SQRRRDLTAKGMGTDSEWGNRRKQCPQRTSVPLGTALCRFCASRKKGHGDRLEACPTLTLCAGICWLGNWRVRPRSEAPARQGGAGARGWKKKGLRESGIWSKF